LTLANIYTDPQKPIQVEPKSIPSANPARFAGLCATNFSSPFYGSGEIETAAPALVGGAGCEG